MGTRSDFDRLQLEQDIEHSWPRLLYGDEKMLLAVSGGADSVAMLRAFQRLLADWRRVEVAHFNHGWRGSESDDDEAFVAQLCQGLGVDYHIGRTAADGRTSRCKASEELARNERYLFLERTAYGTGARYILTAHTATDRVETLLHNLFRGSGLAGARAIEPRRPLGAELVVVRPLLQSTRRQVIDYLGTLSQEYRQDRSNEDIRFRRNFLRHRVLPLIREAYGQGVDRRLLAFADTASEADQLLRDLAEQYWAAVDALPKAPLRLKELQRGAAQSIMWPSSSQLETRWPILHYALAIQWSDKGWPLGGMRRPHWQRVREVYEHCGQRNETEPSPGVIIHCNLPGKLQLLSHCGWLMIRKLEP
jgi:tRNA(Ile)-lysidine synthase